MNINLRKTDEFKWPSSYLHLEFQRVVKTTTGQYSYGGLELIAEIGGYVGLFLGYSVFQIKFVIEKVFQIIWNRMNFKEK